MASDHSQSHSPYPHSPGPGPSNYYQHPLPPPPHYGYTTHRHNPYAHVPAYPHAPPPISHHHMPMNGNANANGNGSVSPRPPLIGRTSSGGYASPLRGGPSFHHHQQPYALQIAHTHPNSHYTHPPAHAHIHSPQPHHHYPVPSPSTPNSTHSSGVKYPPPFSPPYSQHQPHTVPQASYLPSWSTETPLSPLPKQLNVPPPQEQQTQELSPLPSPSTLTLLTPSSPSRTTSIPSQEQENASSSPTLSPLPNLASPLGTTDRTDPPQPETHDSDATTLPSSPAPPMPVSAPLDIGAWAIWSRRPHDPRRAPGIIISPRACPPQDIIRQALEDRTPPASPSPSPHPPPVAEEEKDGQPKEVIEVVVQHADDSDALHEPEPQGDAEGSSKDATEAPDTSIPGSPASSHTSVSAVVVEQKIEAAVGAETLAAESVAGSSEVQPQGVTENAEASPSAPALMPEPASELSSTSTTPAAPAPKKSWASLLRPSGNPSTSNSLPTSSIVGFSIPASDALSSSTKGTNSPNSNSGHPKPLVLPRAPLPPGPPRRVRGLLNSGNMCFANAVLQALIRCPPFWDFFSELGRMGVGAGAGAITSSTGSGVSLANASRGSAGAKVAPLAEATVRFVKENAAEGGWSAEKGKGAYASVKGKGKGKEVDVDGDAEYAEAFVPIYVYDALKDKKRFDHMRGGHQEDAEEFLGFFLDTLEEELLALSNPNADSSSSTVTPATVSAPVDEALPVEEGWLEVGKRNRMVSMRTVKPADSPITRMFGGTFCSTLRAPNQKPSAIIESWRSLRLDIQNESIRTIPEALATISAPSAVQLARVEGSQQVLVESLPPVLILHLKRFLYDATGVVKLGRQVRFGPELEVGREVQMPKRERVKYKLMSVVYHHGQSATGGHYTIDVLHNEGTKGREGWVRIDDELVEDVRAEDVFDGFERDERCAYLLFYRRIGRA